MLFGNGRALDVVEPPVARLADHRRAVFERDLHVALAERACIAQDPGPEGVEGDAKGGGVGEGEGLWSSQWWYLVLRKAWKGKQEAAERITGNGKDRYSFVMEVLERHTVLVQPHSLI